MRLYINSVMAPYHCRSIARITRLHVIVVRRSCNSCIVSFLSTDPLASKVSVRDSMTWMVQRPFTVRMVEWARSKGMAHRHGEVTALESQSRSGLD